MNDLLDRLDQIDRRLAAIERNVRSITRDDRAPNEGRVRYTRKDVAAVLEYLASNYGFSEPLKILRSLNISTINDLAPADYSRAYKLAAERIKEVES